MAAHKIKKKENFHFLYCSLVNTLTSIQREFQPASTKSTDVKKIAKTNKLPKRETNKNHDKKKISKVSVCAKHVKNVETV